MHLGAFSISLAVKDIAASRSFYEKLGFTAIEEPHRQIHAAAALGVERRVGRPRRAAAADGRASRVRRA